MEKEFGINLQFCVCANKKVTHFFSKKIVYVQVDPKKKKKIVNKAVRRRKKGFTQHKTKS